jgi:hypothetical protein
MRPIEFEVNFENKGVTIKSEPGSHVVLSGGPYHPIFLHSPPESPDIPDAIFIFSDLNPSTKYTVTVLSPDIKTVTAHGTFTTPAFNSSPAPLTN